MFFFCLSYVIDFVKIFYENESNMRPPIHSFSYGISSLVMVLTIGAGAVYLLSKGKIRIPYYSSYLSFAAMIFYLFFVLLCNFVGVVNYYLLSLLFIALCFYNYFLFKFSAFDKFLEEKFRTTVFKEDYDLAYYHEPLTKE